MTTVRAPRRGVAAGRGAALGRGAAPTTWVERGLLLLVVALLPLEDHLPTLAGLSMARLLFGVVGLYLVVFRFRELRAMLWQPVFLACYGLVIAGGIIETLHPMASYDELKRLAQMSVGGVLVAALSRDREALRAGLFGYLAAGLWLSLLVVLTSYGGLRAASAGSFEDATMVRGEVFSENPLQANLNRMAFLAGQGAVAGLAFGLGAARWPWRIGLLAGGGVCLVGAFLPLSRGAIVTVVAACAAVLWACKRRRFQALLAGGLLFVGVLVAVPSVVFSRLVFKAQHSAEGKVEGRTQVYTAALERLPEYALVGVGAGHFWRGWGVRNGFAKGHGTLGAHNCWLQLMLYWGLPGLIALGSIFFLAWRCLASFQGEDAVVLGLSGIAVSLALYTLFMHNAYAKEFSLGLGMLAGARWWVYGVRAIGVHRSTHAWRTRRMPRVTMAQS